MNIKISFQYQDDSKEFERQFDNKEQAIEWLNGVSKLAETVQDLTKTDDTF